MPYNPEVPFNDLPPLPPAVEFETVRILKKCIAARAAVAELKGITATIPNPAILLRTIGIQEARLSSEIENIVTTTDDLYQALADTTEASNPAAKEVLCYHEAVVAGVEAVTARPILSTNLFCKIASTIKKHEMDVRCLPGTRIADNRRTIYTPPEGEQVIRQKLKQLEQFIHENSSIDPLVKMALIHYQFEAIHPFADGNGRTGRIINVLYLIQQGLLDKPILYLSRYLIENKNEYYKGLRGVTEHQLWEDWILYLLTGIEETAKSACQKIVDIKNAMDEALVTLKKGVPKIASKDLVELLFYYPYCKQKFMIEHHNVTRQTASTYLRQIEELGLVQSVKVGRDVYYVNRRLLQILLH